MSRHYHYQKNHKYQNFALGKTPLDILTGDSLKAAYHTFIKRDLGSMSLGKTGRRGARNVRQKQNFVDAGASDGHASVGSFFDPCCN